MPYRTRYGKHYHMEQGCHGAEIPCGTEGLTPCSDCCGKTGAGSVPRAATGAAAAGSPRTGTTGTAGTPESNTATENPDTTPTGQTPTSERSAGISRAGRQAISENPHAPLPGIPAGTLKSKVRTGRKSWKGDGEPEEFLDRNGNPYKVMGIDYKERGQGWPEKDPRRHYERPGGHDDSSLGRKQTGAVYAAVKRGDVTLDERQLREMYQLADRPWGSLDVWERAIVMSVEGALPHLAAGRKEVAQAILDGYLVTRKTRVIGTHVVRVTEDNILDFEFDAEHDYKVGDLAEAEITGRVWRIVPGSRIEPWREEETG